MQNRAVPVYIMVPGAGFSRKGESWHEPWRDGGEGLDHERDGGKGLERDGGEGLRLWGWPRHELRLRHRHGLGLGSGVGS